MRIAHLLAASVIAIALGACHWDRGEARDPGPTVDRPIQVGQFTGIEVAGPYDVTVKAEGQPGIIAHGGEHLIDATEFKVDGSTLQIGPKDENRHFHWGPDGRVVVTISGVPSLAAASMAGSGGIRVERSNAPSFKGEIAGSGNISVDQLQTGDASFAIGGSGQLQAKGTAQRVKAEIAGSGNIDAGGLNATDAEVSIAGSGNAAVHASGAAKVSIMGSGDASVTGGAKCNVSKMGSGNVTCS